MSKLLLFIMLLSITINYSFARQVNYNEFEGVEVGFNPVYSFHYGTVTHVFCAGKDVNGNGVLDEAAGDESPSWWTIGKSGDKFIANKMKTFEFQSIAYDFKPEIDKQNGNIYIPFKNKISSYKLLTTELINDAIYTGNIEAVKFAGTHLLIIEKGEMNATTYNYDKNTLAVFNLQTSMVLQSIPLDTNATDLILLTNDAGENSIYILCNPVTNSDKFRIQFAVLPHTQMPTFTSTELVGVNSFIEKDGKVYVSCKEDRVASIGKVNEMLAIFTNGEVQKSYTGIKVFEASAMNVIGDELLMATPALDARWVKDDGNVDFISNFEMLEIDNFKHLSYWGNEYLVLLANTAITNNNVYIGKEKPAVDLFKYIKVGSQPAKIVYSTSNDSYNIFCLGIDANFNGAFDDGDELPSWWIIQGKGTQVSSKKVFDFQMGDLKFPLKLAYDPEIDLVYIPHQGKISSYDVLGHTLVEENVYVANAMSADLAGPHLMFPVRNDDKKDELVIYDRANSNVLQTIPGGENILESVYFTHSEGIGIAILNEGNYGASDATLMYGTLPHTQLPNLNVLNIGMTGNDITFNNGYIGTTSNGSHNINIVRFEDNEVTELKTGTTGYNGPRNIKLNMTDDFECFITTYNNDVRFLTNEGLGDILKTKGKAEDLFINPEKEILLATIISNDDYSANNQVAIFGNIITSVEDKIESKLDIKAYPNPTSDYVYIRNNSPIKEIQLFDINGKLVYSNNNQNELVKIDLMNVHTGAYIVRVIDNNSVKTTKINVVK